MRRASGGIVMGYSKKKIGNKVGFIMLDERKAIKIRVVGQFSVVPVYFNCRDDKNFGQAKIAGVANSLDLVHACSVLKYKVINDKGQKLIEMFECLNLKCLNFIYLC